MLVIFYRGGWCPFCRESLLALEEMSTTKTVVLYHG